MSSRRQHGFTLIEISIGLMIMGLVTMGLVATLSQQAEQRRLIETRALLTQAREALLAFVSANGRLPCPAVAASSGQESVLAIVNGVTTCTTSTGFLPAVTLGMPGLDPGGWVTDAWRDSGNPPATLPRVLRYGVAAMAGAGAPAANALTSVALGASTGTNNPATIRGQVQAALGVTGQGLFVCASAAGIGGAGARCGPAANTLAFNAVAVVWSLGANGSVPALYSADETQNAAPGALGVWIDRTYAPQGAVGGNFDDLLTWIPYPLVADRLVKLGYVQ